MARPCVVADAPPIRRDEIHALLHAWSAHLDTATRIFMSCAKSNRALLYADESPLTKGVCWVVAVVVP